MEFANKKYHFFAIKPLFGTPFAPLFGTPLEPLFGSPFGPLFGAQKVMVFNEN